MKIAPSDIRKFFNPKSIAFIGVSRSAEKFGGLSFMKKFQEAGFSGRLYPVNPKAKEVLGYKVWPDLEALPEIPDLAVVSVSAAYVPDVLEACGRVGLRHVHIFTSGFGETGTREGINLEKRLAGICRDHGIQLIGPNCMGPYCPASRLTAWGAIPGLPGPLGIISQSGGMTQRLTEYTASLGLGVSKAVSFGNGTVLDALDWLESFGEDESLRVIGMYLERLPDGRRFLETARRIGRRKPVILLRGGETGAGARTAASHTGAMGGNAVLFRAAAAQANVVQVENLDEWVDALLAFSLLPRPLSEDLFLIGGGGGNSVIYGDTCVRQGLSVPPLSKGTMSRLREMVPTAGSIAGNPLDLWTTYTDTDCVGELIDLAEADTAVSMIVVDRLIPRMAYHMPTADTTPQMIERLKGRAGKKPILFVVDSEGGDSELAARGAAIRAALGAAGYPPYPSIYRAARALAKLCRYHRRLSNGDV